MLTDPVMFFDVVFFEITRGFGDVFVQQSVI